MGGHLYRDITRKEWASKFLDQKPCLKTASEGDARSKVSIEH